MSRTVKEMLEKSAKKRQLRNAFRQPPQEELDEKAKAEEFWSDPCWTEPLDKTDQ